MASLTPHIPLATAIVPVGKQEDLRQWVEDLRLYEPRTLIQLLAQRNITVVDDLYLLDPDMAEIELGMAETERGQTMKSKDLSRFMYKLRMLHAERSAPPLVPPDAERDTGPDAGPDARARKPVARTKEDIKKPEKVPGFMRSVPPPTAKAAATLDREEFFQGSMEASSNPRHAMGFVGSATPTGPFLHQWIDSIQVNGKELQLDKTSRPYPHHSETRGIPPQESRRISCTEIRVTCCSYEQSSEPSKVRGDYVNELHLGLCLETGMHAGEIDSAIDSAPEGFEDVRLRLVTEQVHVNGQRVTVYSAPLLQADHMYLLYTKKGAGVAKGGPFRNPDSFQFFAQSWRELSSEEQATQRQKDDFLV